MKKSLALLATWLVVVAARGQTSTTTVHTPEESEAMFREMLCGSQGMPPTSTEIPTIGCFGVPSGGTARGMLDGHQFEVTIDARGEPKCRFDGAAGECNGCVGPQVPECQVRLTLVSRNPDKSVSFSVQQRTDGNRYAFRIDSWNKYREQKQSREEAAAFRDHQQAAMAAAPSVSPSPPSDLPAAPPPPSTEPRSPPASLTKQGGAERHYDPNPTSTPEATQPGVVFHAPPPGLPPGLVPGTFPENDGPNAMHYLGLKAQSYFRPDGFRQLDQFIELLSRPDEVADDGRPRLAALNPGLTQYFDAWQQWKWHLEMTASWRKETPDSYAADMVEAIILRSWAWSARGSGYANTVTDEGRRLFKERLQRAAQVLDASRSRGRESPLWYELRLSVAGDIGVDRSAYLAIFKEGIGKFPNYLPLYFITTTYLSPKWGGSYEAVDAFAHTAANPAPGGKNPSMYARIYWSLAQNEELGFNLFADSLASWPEMKRGFEDLLQKYPKSVWNLNAFASFACRANDGATYGSLRSRLGERILSEAWPENLSVEVCDARLLNPS